MLGHHWCIDLCIGFLETNRLLQHNFAADQMTTEQRGSFPLISTREQPLEKATSVSKSCNENCDRELSNTRNRPIYPRIENAASKTTQFEDPQTTHNRRQTAYRPTIAPISDRT